MAYYIVLDTETTNGFDDPLVYDCGWSIIDHTGKTIKTRSFVNADIFINEPELIVQAYFMDKIPQYVEDILAGKRVLAKWFTIRKRLQEDCDTYNVIAIVAHNARFDYKACQTTQRYLTKSKYRWFFPYGVRIFDSLKMAEQTFAKDEAYRDYCANHSNYWVRNRPRLTAEIIYRYITGDDTFEESHTGLEDTEIEKQIFWECIKRNPQVKCDLWG